jgi:pyruvate/2-oxoglutarate dehydrogenase complex dihydrolipoamide dehydrogenase (E3) component
MEHFDAIAICTGQAGPALAAKHAWNGLSVAMVERKNGIVMKLRADVTNWLTGTPAFTLIHADTPFEFPRTIRVRERLATAPKISPSVGAQPYVAVKGADLTPVGGRT